MGSGGGVKAKIGFSVFKHACIVMSAVPLMFSKPPTKQRSFSPSWRWRIISRLRRGARIVVTHNVREQAKARMYAV